MILWLLQGTSLMLFQAHKWGAAPSTGRPDQCVGWRIVVRREFQNWWWPIECEDPSYINFCLSVSLCSKKHDVMVAARNISHACWSTQMRSGPFHRRPGPDQCVGWRIYSPKRIPELVVADWVWGSFIYTYILCVSVALCSKKHHHGCIRT